MMRSMMGRCRGATELAGELDWDDERGEETPDRVEYNRAGQATNINRAETSSNTSIVLISANSLIDWIEDFYYLIDWAQQSSVIDSNGWL